MNGSKAKEISRDITISRGDSEEKEPSTTKRPQSTWQRNHSIPRSLSLGFKSFWSNTFKSTFSMKRSKTNKNLQMVPEAARDPREEQLVESLQKMVFLEAEDHLLGKHTEYHTLLR